MDTENAKENTSNYPKTTTNKKQKRLLLVFDRILSQNLSGQVLILVGLLFVIFICSFLLLSLSGGSWKVFCKCHNISQWAFPLYLLIDGNAFHDFCSSTIVGPFPVFIACIIYVIGVIVFTGMIISVMTNMIEQRVNDYKEGHIHYLKSGHYIIMGYDEMVPSIIRHIRRNDTQSYILILTAARVPYINKQLRKSFSEREMERIVINYAHRTTSDSYSDIHLEASKEIYIVGYKALPAHDAINVECVDCIYRYLEKLDFAQKPEKITCVFKDLDTYSAFKTTEIFSRITGTGIDFVPYNYYAGWAKQVFVKKKYQDVDGGKEYNYPSVYGNGIVPDDPKFVHLVFVGTTNFAVAFAMEAAHVLHFPNFRKNPELRTRITFIDINADVEKDEFITRNRHFFEVQPYRYQDLSENSNDHSVHISQNDFGTEGNFLDVEFEFIKGNVFSKRVQDEIRTWAVHAKDEQYLSIFLAMENQRNNFLMSMNMPDEVYDYNIPIFIRQDRSDNLVTNLRETDKNVKDYFRKDVSGQLLHETRSSRYSNIYPFGMNETAFCADDKSVKRAKLINYLYTYCFPEVREEDGIMRKADDEWKKLPVSLKWSNMYNSYTIRTKIATLRAMRGLNPDEKYTSVSPLNDNEVLELAWVEHNRWNVEKLLMGFRKPRKYEDALDKGNDNEKDVLKKNKELFIHHDIRPYNDLDDIKDLDKKFAQFIPWIINVSENNLNNTDMNSNDYKPEPIDTSDVVLPDSLKPLLEAMAKNVHEVWAQTRIRQGWKYGPCRDDSKKMHPMLVAYEDLPDQEKEYDRNTSIETLKLIIKLGFTISDKQ